MRTTFDTDSIIYSVLNQSPVRDTISGGIYLGDDRPENSTLEDVCINSIDISQDYLPQIGTSNVNIFVSDMQVMINGVQQMKSNRRRMQELARMAISALKEACIDGLVLIVGGQTILAEPTVKQHYVNIRVDWNICSE